MPDRFRGVPHISKHITTRFIDDEAFLMNLENLKTYYFNETASRIWSLACQGKTVDEIVRFLIAHYDVSHEACLDEVSKITEAWVSEHLIDFVEDNA